MILIAGNIFGCNCYRYNATIGTAAIGMEEGEGGGKIENS